MKNKARMLLSLLLLPTCALAQQQPAQEKGPARASEVLTLERAISLAVEHNRSLRIAQIEAEKSGDQIAATRTKRFPQTSLNMLGSQLLSKVSFEFEKGAFGDFPATGPIPATDTRITTPRRPNLYVIGNVSQPLSQLYKINMGITQNKIGQQLQEEEIRVQRQGLIHRIRTLYYNALQAQAALDASRESLNFYREMDRLTSELLAQQAALKSDNLDVRAKLAKEEYDALQLENQLSAAKEQLNQEMGRDIREEFLLGPAPEATPLETDLSAAREVAMANRPELRQMRLKVKGAQQDRRIKRADYIPEISMSFNYISPFSIEVLPKNVAAIGLQLSWEPWDWGRRKHELKEKDRTIEQAELAARDVETKVLLDVSQTRRKLREARALIGVARAAQETAQERLRVTKNRYAEQAVLFKDVLQAQMDSAQAAKSFQQAVLAFWTARADFEKAIGEDR